MKRELVLINMNILMNKDILKIMKKMLLSLMNSIMTVLFQVIGMMVKLKDLLRMFFRRSDNYR